MKRLLTIALFAAAGAGMPLVAAAHPHARYDHEQRYMPERHYHRHAYAPSAFDARHGRYIAPRQWIDRNGDGMNDRRGRRDLDRDGVPDRYDRDLDNDGVANRYDRDVDGDGVRNYRDRRPTNPYAY